MYISTLGAAVVFLLIVSTDLFVCGFGYGASKIHVPFRKVLPINIIGSFMIGIGLFSGYYISSLTPKSITQWLAFGVLFGLGLCKTINWFFTQSKKINRQLQPISWRETIFLGIALSVDGLAIGVGATIDDFGLAFIFTVIALSLVTDHLVFHTGQHLGNKITRGTKLNLSWLSGILLIGLAISGLIL